MWPRCTYYYVASLHLLLRGLVALVTTWTRCTCYYVASLHLLLCGLIALVHINKVTLLSQVSNEMEFNGDNGFIVLVCNQPPRPTQLQTLSEMGNEYKTKFCDSL